MAIGMSFKVIAINLVFTSIPSFVSNVMVLVLSSNNDEISATLVRKYVQTEASVEYTIAATVICLYFKSISVNIFLKSDANS